MPCKIKIEIKSSGQECPLHTSRSHAARVELVPFPIFPNSGSRQSASVLRRESPALRATPLPQDDKRRSKSKSTINGERTGVSVLHGRRCPPLNSRGGCSHMFVALPRNSRFLRSAVAFAPAPVGMTKVWSVAFAPALVGMTSGRGRLLRGACGLPGCVPVFAWFRRQRRAHMES